MQIKKKKGCFFEQRDFFFPRAIFAGGDTDFGKLSKGCRRLLNTA
jgi:hypothetical protein